MSIPILQKIYLPLLVAQHHWQGDLQLGEVGTGLVGIHVEAYGEAAERGEGIVQAYTLIVFLFPDLGVDAHLPEEVIA